MGNGCAESFGEETAIGSFIDRNLEAAITFTDLSLGMRKLGIQSEPSKGCDGGIGLFRKIILGPTGLWPLARTGVVILVAIV